jgi:ABC-type anion transport system duplicated permease subunit
VFFVAVFIVAILSGTTAAVVGFGVGSLMTPLLAIRFGTTTAVALVTLPHAAATAVRCCRLRAHVDRCAEAHEQRTETVRVRGGQMRAIALRVAAEIGR